MEIIPRSVLASDCMKDHEIVSKVHRKLAYNKKTLFDLLHRQKRLPFPIPSFDKIWYNPFHIPSLERCMIPF